MEKIAQKIKKKENRFLYAIKNRNPTDKNSQGSIGPISSNFALALTKTELGQDYRTIEGVILQQQKNKAGLYQLSFQLKHTVKINQENALLHFPLNCIQISGKMILVEEDYRKFMTEFKTLFKSQDSQDQQYSDSNSNFISSQISVSQKGRGRPKGSRNRKRQDDSNSSDDQYLEEQNKNNQQKRGRGRPKGAKNKKKCMSDQLLNQTNLSLLFMNLFSNKSIQQISNRLLKLRQKQQYQANLIKKQQGEGKRGRGRPKGVRNKPKICNDESQSQELVPAEHFPKRKPIKNVSQLKCCSKCSQKITKRQFIDGKNVPLQDLKNLGLNLGVEDDLNVILNVINQEELLRKILSRKDYTQNQFVIPWQVNSKLELCNYTVRTKKQHILKNKRQGIYALVQDCYRYEQKWWKAIGVDRILQNLPNSPQSIQIYNILTEDEPQLVKQINLNIPSLVRNGNQFLSVYLMEKLLKTEQNAKIYGFSELHVDCLSKNLLEIHFRKPAMLKQNFTQNFCSPIHCAAINSNTQLLTYILKHITDFNVGDSQCRRPIHYAVMVDNPKNMQILVKYGADLKDIDKKKVTPLMIAAKFGNYKNIKFILERVRDAQYINFKSDQGLSALHYATIGRHSECLYLLMEDPLVQKNIQTKQGMNILHLAAGTGQKDVVKTLLQKGITIQPDNFRRTPLMIAIRNNHNDIFFNLFFASGKYYRRDFSHNTLLHYAAAYGNVQIVKYLLETKLNLQTPNKKNFYPYQIAVLKGHFQCAKILQNWNLHYNQHLVIRILKNPRGTDQFFQMLEYLLQTKKYDVDYQLPNSYNFTALHYVCSLGQNQYLRYRSKETSEIKQQEYDLMQQTIIKMLLKHGADPDIENQRGELPVNLCIQNQNMVGIKLLMKQIPFNLHTETKANNFIYYLTNLNCQGAEQSRFVLQKLKQSDEKMLKEQVKTKHWNGFSFLVYLVKRFVQNALYKFSLSFLKHFNTIKQNQELKFAQIQKQACLKAFQEYVDHQNAFMDLITYLVQIGADPRVIVVSPKMQKQHINYKKWGIQHFLMKFPSPKLLKLFMKWIDTNFNMQNSQGRTPLHLFCKWNKDENIFNPTQYRKIDKQCIPIFPYIKYEQMKQYEGKRSLQYLLEKGLTSNVLDINRSTPLLYSAINGQISFINLLRTFGSSINNVNLMNQIPLIEIIKKKNTFTIQDIESIMTDQGADPQFKDLNQRNSLHHLVSNAKNFDNSPQICKLLIQHGVSINSLDKFHRSPIFYCFIKIQPQQLHPSQKTQKSVSLYQNEGQTDNVQILQTLLQYENLNLNVIDIYHRTPLHYACQKKFFFSILYLLDKNIDYDIMDNEGNTPLAICLKHRNLNQAALLIKRGIKYGHVIDQGVKYSYFAYAINKLSVGICFMLIDHGYPLQKALQEAPNQDFKNVLKKRYV